MNPVLARIPRAGGSLSRQKKKRSSLDSNNKRHTRNHLKTNKGNLKRSNPDLPEDVVLIRAMRDSNVPKFVAEDLPLFSALIQDLFPGELDAVPFLGELDIHPRRQWLRFDAPQRSLEGRHATDLQCGKN